ncbi:unnamed protein product, partial [Meganyctiphanes norvegica]
MGTQELPCYTLIHHASEAEQPSEMQLKSDLENGDIATKQNALKKVIQLILNGERLPGILMHVIRFVMPLEDHTIKKLLLVFWEIVPKTTGDGKLMQEMILVCDAYRKDLSHPNEFIRGSTLRFLCKLKEPELLEPLMPTIRTCLEHRHSYVRRNAVLAIFTIYKNFDFLIPDAPELISNFLEGEQDMSCKRNAFMMLIHADQERALTYLSTCIDQVNSFGDILQLVIVELIYKVCHANPSERARFIRCIYNLLNSSSPAVRYEAAGTLVTLSSAPTAIKAAANCYIELIVKESDNNVKLIVLDRLVALKEVPQHEKILQELAMDVLRILSTPDLEVRRKTLNLAMELVTLRSVTEMVEVLKKEVGKTHNTVEHEDTGKYRQLLVRTLHSISIKFPDIAASVIPILMDFLSDSNELAATDVLVFVREAIQRLTPLRPQIVERLMSALPTIRSATVHCHTLWILGEYATTKDKSKSMVNSLSTELEELPCVSHRLREPMPQSGMDQNGSSIKHHGPKKKHRSVTADGTYATQSAFSTNTTVSKTDDRPPLRRYLLEGNFYLGAVIANTLVKLSFRHNTLEPDNSKQNSFGAESMLIISSIVHLGKSGLPTKAMTDDDYDRMMLCLQVISEGSPAMDNLFTEQCRSALSRMLTAKEAEAESMRNDKKQSKLLRMNNMGPLSHFRDRGESHDVDVMGQLNIVPIQPGTSWENLGLRNAFLWKVMTVISFQSYKSSYLICHMNVYDPLIVEFFLINQLNPFSKKQIADLITQRHRRFSRQRRIAAPPPAPCCVTPNSDNKPTHFFEKGLLLHDYFYNIERSDVEDNVVMLDEWRADTLSHIKLYVCMELQVFQGWQHFNYDGKLSTKLHINRLKIRYFEQFLKKGINDPRTGLSPARGLVGT